MGLDGIAPAPRGIPQIEVTFDIDANGILAVTAKDKATNKQQSITISGASNLQKDEVEKMVEEAEKNPEADKEKSKKIELKNTGDSMVYQTKKQLVDLESRLSNEDKQQVEMKISDLEKALNEENYANVETEKDALQKLMLEIGQKAYDTNDAPDLDPDVIE